MKELIYSNYKRFFPVLSTKRKYKKVYGEKMDLKNPKTFSEKIQWLNLYVFPKSHDVIFAAAKSTKSEYLDQKGGIPHLKPLKVYTNISDINWDDLPNAMVIKMSNAAGRNIIIQDKKSIDKMHVIAQLQTWTKSNFGFLSGERHYAKMAPDIVVEQYEESLGDEYKLFTFNGEVKMIDFAQEIVEANDFKSGVFIGKGAPIRLHMDANWEKLNFNKIDDEFIPEKPKQLNTMIDIAQKLGRDFPFVRVDLFVKNDEVLVNELSFTPSGGWADYLKPEAQIWLGNQLDLSQEMR